MAIQNHNEDHTHRTCAEVKIQFRNQEKIGLNTVLQKHIDNSVLLPL